MKVGELVHFRGKDYRVGPSKTKASIELVELENESRGLWVSRDQVRRPLCSQSTRGKQRGDHSHPFR